MSSLGNRSFQGLGFKADAARRLDDLARSIAALERQQVVTSQTLSTTAAKVAMTSPAAVLNITNAIGGTSNVPNFAYRETPAGVQNSVNRIFTFANAPNPGGSLQLFRDGALMSDGGIDFALTGRTISWVVPPNPGEKIIAWYSY